MLSVLGDIFASPIAVALAAVVLGGVAFLAFVLAKHIPAGGLLGFIMLISLVQFYLHGYVTVAVITMAMFALPVVVDLVRQWRTLPASLILVLVALTLWPLVAIGWSENLGSGLMPAGFALCTLVCVVIAHRTMNQDGQWRKALAIFAPGLALFSALVILFRAVPAAEEAYFRSPVAMIFSEPDVTDYPEVWQNVYDVDKAGGLLLNGNTASMLLAVSALLLAVSFCTSGNRFHAGVSAVATVAVIATGSKTPLLLAAICAASAAVLVLFARGRWRLATAIAGGVVAVGVFAVTLGQRIPPIASFLVTFDDRVRLWGFAGEQFWRSPWLGLGFNHWIPALEPEFPRVFPGRGFQAFPPHSFIIEAWSGAGLVYAALVTVVVALPVVWGLRAVWRVAGGRMDRAFWARTLTWVAALWIPLHGLADTTQFYGSLHTIPLFAAIAMLARRVFRTDQFPAGVLPAAPHAVPAAAPPGPTDPAQGHPTPGHPTPGHPAPPSPAQTHPAPVRPVTVDSVDAAP